MATPMALRQHLPVSFLTRRVFLSPPLGFMQPASRLDFSQKPRRKRLRWEMPVNRGTSNVRGDLRTSPKAGKVGRVSQAGKIPEAEVGGDRWIHRHRPFR